MNDRVLWPLSWETEEQDDLDPELDECMDQLCSDDEDERIQAASAIWELAPWKNPDEIALMIHAGREDSALPLFGWVQFCLQNGMPIWINWVEATFLWVLWNYRESIQIILHGAESDRLEEKQSGVAQMRHRIKDMTNRLIDNENEEAKNYGYCMKLKVMQIFDQSIERIQAVYDTCPLPVRQSEEMMEILADGYEKAKDYLHAFDLYRTLQVRTGKPHFLWSQIMLLYKMGRIAEAKTLYKFGSTIWNHGNTLLPECVYRWTIENDKELREIYQIFLPLYKGECIDATTKKFMALISEYVIKRLSYLEEIFSKAEKKKKDIYDTNFDRLWVEKLFLLEVAVWMLGHTGSFWPYVEWVGIKYILTLRDLFWTHVENPSGSVLEKYFALHRQEWMDIVRDIHGDTPSKGHEGMWDSEDSMEDAQKSGNASFIWRDSFAEGLEDSFVTQRLDNILDFLLDRIENDHPDNKELLGELLDFQSVLSEHSKDIPSIDISDVRFAGDLVRKSVAAFSSSDRESYRALVDYIWDQYGSSIYQFLFFLSANTSQSDTLSFKGIQKDPKLLLLSIVITLLSLDTPPLPRIREFISNPILEALSENETIFLCRMLYRAGLFREVCIFLIADREAFGYAECIELFFQSLACIDDVSMQEFFEEGLDAISDFGDYKDFEWFIEKMKGDIPEAVPHLQHVQMILYTLWDNSGEPTNQQVPTFSLDTKFTALEARIQLTHLRSIEVQEWDREKWTRSLMFLYPFLDIDKKHALDAICSWTFHLGLRLELERFIALGESDGFPSGYWQYAPLLLGNLQEQQEWIDAISKDPFLHVIPEPIIWWIEQHFPDELDDPSQGSISLWKRFQLSYITAYSWIQGVEKLEKIALHFHRLDAYIQTCLRGQSRFDNNALERVFELFYATEHLKRWEPQRDALTWESISSSEVLAGLLISHISEFRRYLDLCWDEMKDASIMTDESRRYLQGVIDALESITDLFDHNTSEYTKLSFSIQDLKNQWWIPSNQSIQNDRICDDWTTPLPATFS